MDKMLIGNARDRLNLGRAENYRLSARTRSANMHDLIESAAASRDNDLWTEIAHLLIRACDCDDLSTQVSDHFVDTSPDEVFREVANSSPRSRFRAWNNRARKLGL